MEPYPLPGVFAKPYEATGASKESNEMPVPATAATVIFTKSNPIKPGLVVHCTDVELVQALVEQ